METVEKASYQVPVSINALEEITPSVTFQLQNFCSLALDNLKAYKPEISRLDQSIAEMMKEANLLSKGLKRNQDYVEHIESTLSSQMNALDARVAREEALTAVLPVWKEELINRIDIIARDNRSKWDLFTSRIKMLEDNVSVNSQMTRDQLGVLQERTTTHDIILNRLSERIEAVGAEGRQAAKEAAARLSELESKARVHSDLLEAQDRKTSELGTQLGMVMLNEEHLRGRIDTLDHVLTSSQLDIARVTGVAEANRGVLENQSKKLDMLNVICEQHDSRLESVEKDPRLAQLMQFKNATEAFKGEVENFVLATKQQITGISENMQTMESRLDRGPPALWRLTSQVDVHAEELASVKNSVAGIAARAEQLAAEVAMGTNLLDGQRTLCNSLLEEQKETMLRLNADSRKMVRYMDERLETLARRYEVEALKNYVDEVRKNLSTQIADSGHRVKFELLHDEMPQVATLKEYMEQVEELRSRLSEKVGNLEAMMHLEHERGSSLESAINSTRDVVSSVMVDGVGDLPRIKRELGKLRAGFEALGVAAAKGAILTKREVEALVDSRFSGKALQESIEQHIADSSLIAKYSDVAMEMLATKFDVEGVRRALDQTREDMVGLLKTVADAADMNAGISVRPLNQTGSPTVPILIAPPPAGTYAGSTGSIPAAEPARAGEQPGLRVAAAGREEGHITVPLNLSLAPVTISPRAPVLGEAARTAAALLATEDPYMLHMSRRLYALEDQTSRMTQQIASNEQMCTIGVAGLRSDVGGINSRLSSLVRDVVEVRGLTATLDKMLDAPKAEELIRHHIDTLILPDFLSRQTNETKRILRYLDDHIMILARRAEVEGLQGLIGHVATQVASILQSLESDDGAQYLRSVSTKAPVEQLEPVAEGFGRRPSELDGFKFVASDMEAPGGAKIQRNQSKTRKEVKKRGVSAPPTAMTTLAEDEDSAGPEKLERRGSLQLVSEASFSSMVSVDIENILKSNGEQAAGVGGEDGEAGPVMSPRDGVVASKDVGWLFMRTGELQEQLSRALAQIQDMGKDMKNMEDRVNLQLVSGLNGVPKLEARANATEAALGDVRKSLRQLHESPELSAAIDARLAGPSGGTIIASQVAAAIQSTGGAVAGMPGYQQGVSTGLLDELRGQVDTLQRHLEAQAEELQRLIMEIGTGSVGRAASEDVSPLVARLSVSVSALEARMASLAGTRVLASNMSATMAGLASLGTEVAVLRQMVTDAGVKEQHERLEKRDVEEMLEAMLVPVRATLAQMESDLPNLAKNFEVEGLRHLLAGLREELLAKVANMGLLPHLDPSAPSSKRSRRIPRGPDSARSQSGLLSPSDSLGNGAPSTPRPSEGAAVRVVWLGVDGDENSPAVQAVKGWVESAKAAVTEVLTRMGALESSVAVMKQSSRASEADMRAVENRLGMKAAGMEEGMRSVMQRLEDRRQAMDKLKALVAACESGALSRIEQLVAERLQNHFAAMDSSIQERMHELLPAYLEPTVLEGIWTKGQGNDVSELVMLTPSTSPSPLQIYTAAAAGSSPQRASSPMSPKRAPTLQPIQVVNRPRSVGANEAKHTTTTEAANRPASAAQNASSSAPLLGSPRRGLSSASTRRRAFSPSPSPLNEPEHTDIELSGMIHDLAHAMHEEVNALRSAALPDALGREPGAVALRDAAAARLKLLPAEVGRHVDVLEQARGQMVRLMQRNAASSVDHLVCAVVMLDLRVRAVEDIAEVHKEQIATAYRNLEAAFDYLGRLQEGVAGRASASGLNALERALRDLGRTVALLVEETRGSPLAAGRKLADGEWWHCLSCDKEAVVPSSGRPVSPAKSAVSHSDSPGIPAAAAALPPMNSQASTPATGSSREKSQPLNGKSSRPNTPVINPPARMTVSTPPQPSSTPQGPLDLSLAPLHSQPPVMAPMPGAGPYPPPTFMSAKRDILGEQERMLGQGDGSRQPSRQGKVASRLMGTNARNSDELPNIRGRRV